jgi:hypothetical protein
MTFCVCHSERPRFGLEESIAFLPEPTYSNPFDTDSSGKITPWDDFLGPGPDFLVYSLLQLIAITI